MKEIDILITGATGLQGCFLLKRLAEMSPQMKVHCLIRPTSNLSSLANINLDFDYIMGDSSLDETWESILKEYTPKTIIHIASIRHAPVILQSLTKVQQKPRLIIIGTTGVYSQYNQYSAIYKEIEQELSKYDGDCCLLRPTMIYGSDRDKNLHKLIKFCSKYHFFFVFGEGKNLLQPVHADDLAQATLFVLQNPHIKGTYDLSGGSVVNFLELLNLIETILNKPIRKLSFPLGFGILGATILETILGKRSPVRKEQILRLQEDKAYPNDKARHDLKFSPRNLEIGLRQEVEILRQKNLI